MSRRAKLVCTLGPSTWTAVRVRALVEAGMDVARVNFSHASEDQRPEAARLVREAAEAAGRTVALMADLPGPKVRLGELAAGTIRLRTGDRFVLRSEDGAGDAAGASTTHAGLPQDLRAGDRVLLADGAVELTVRETDGARVVTDVARGGRVTSRAGVSVPAARLSVSSITEKDRAGLAAALDLGFDLVGQSFVRSPEDVERLRALMGERRVPIVAKIETGPAVAAASGIVDVADAVMVARGDLGVDRPLEEVPIIQKEIVRACRLAGVPSIVATQMLESMVGAPRPTRAEVSDVANAILDGADAVMLSAETAIGRYPVEAARTAVAVAEIAEARGHDFRPSLPDRSTTDPRRAVARAATRLSLDQAGVRAIACFARTGRTAGLIAAERPPVPLFVFASDPSVLRMLAGVWGIIALGLRETPHDVDAMIAAIDRGLVGGGHLHDGDRVVLVGAAPAGIADTNLIKLHSLGSPGYR